MMDRPHILQAMFSAQMRTLDPEREAGSVHPLELLLEDDLPVRISLHPQDRHWVVEAFVYDALVIPQIMRNALVSLLLKINGAALEGRQIMCSLDSSDLLVVITRWAVQEGQSEQFLLWLDYTIKQARRIREMAQAILMDDGDKQNS